MILINNDTDLMEIVPEIRRNQIIGLDVEATGLDPYTSTLLLVQLSTPDEIYIINAGRVKNNTLRSLFRTIKDDDIQVVGHNLKYDIKMVYHNFSILLTNVFDTMLAESFQLLGISKKFPSYAYVVDRYCNVRLPKNVRLEFVGKEDFEFTEEQLLYSANDVKYLLPLKEILSKKLIKNQSQSMWDLETRLEPVVALMEYQGVLLNTTRWRELAGNSEIKAEEYYNKIERYLAERFDQYAGRYENGLEAAMNIKIAESFDRKYKKEALASLKVKDEIIAALVPQINLNSPTQMLIVLQGLGVRTKSSSQKELQKFAGNEFISLLFKYREYYKAGHAFGEEFLSKINPVTGRIHGNFDQQGAATGRFSSSDPNLQNVKSDIDYRSCFLARDGYKFFTADYSQIELRILAEISREPLMIEAFQNGEDLHKLTASIIFDKPMSKVTAKERARAKNVNFAVVYGTTEWGLQYNFGWPLDVGKKYLTRYFDKYATLSQFIDAVGYQVIGRRYSTTQYGRKRYFALPDRLHRKHIRMVNKVKRQGVNHTIQGGSADMIKLNLNNMFWNNPFDKDPEFPDLFRVLLTVHDEGDGEFREDLEEDAKAFIGESMIEASKPFLNDVPVEFNIEVDTCWRK
jgi:DNA polymerase I-like protein with 3'-5' exonuclease and polymerase domains